MSFASSLLGALWSLPPRKYPANRTQALSVPMRDGTILSADLYQPREPAQPTILVRTPYGRGLLFGVIAELFAERGYQVLQQSCRGTRGSAGELAPFLQERSDGLDTVDWLEKQPWFAGRLATYGASYLGYVQWAIAADLGERLSAMAIAMSLSNFSEEIRQGGGFTLEGMLTWTRMMALQREVGLEAILKQLISRGVSREIFNQLPLERLDALATGHTVRFWQDWVGQDSAQGGIWAAIDRRATLEKVTAPVTMVAGWSDIFLPSQLRDFSALRAHERNVRILIGPWNHFSSVGKVPVLDALEWFDHQLKGAPLKSTVRVRYELEGEGRWHEADQWPIPQSRPWTLQLSHCQRLGAEPTDESGDDLLVYDPANPTPSVAGPTLNGAKKHGSLKALRSRKDVLWYEGAPLSMPVDLIGPVFAELVVSCDAATYDLFACLCEVGADDNPIHISDGYVRVADGQAVPVPGPRSVRVECWPIARRIARHHKLCVLVTAGAHPRYARNLGVAGKLGDATAMQTVHLRIQRSGSHVVLPLADLSPAV